FALDAACWGAPRGEGLALPDPPPPAGMDRAQAVLEGLGAVDADGRATARGRELARIPADPRHARALLDGAQLVGRRTAARLTADRRSPAGDLVADRRALDEGRAPDAAAWERDARRLEGLASPGGDPTGPGGSPAGPDDRRALPLDEAVGAVVALAHPDRIAQRRGAQYSFVSGT